MMNLFTPLEQFELTVLIPLYFLGFDFSITTMTFYLFFVCFFVIIFLFFGTYKALLVPRLLQSLVEFIYKFIYSMIMQQAGIGGKQYFAIFFTTFLLFQIFVVGI